ncbi:MAG: serine--tRNA ligase [Euryarchaeota archaeon]|nr:serine--tRNA ligase [Euryarchaeota archaeon]MDE1835107.1 serine--tRNA ligase [Euryarchaeota archaeon]MDE1880707.1 serine--tRNA ligase [Euryarchaeota archaeon]MDE2044930.1 serine--tRNA ligase [Thermoplasmata archaeon]
MIDLDLVRREPEKVKENLGRRQVPQYLELFATVQAADNQWRRLHQEGDRLRKRRNELSRALGEARKKGEDAKELSEEAQGLPDKLTEVERLERTSQETRDRTLMRVPNLLETSVPYGKDDRDNATVATWGEVPKPSFPLLSHGELAEKLGIADFDRARRASGAGFFYLEGALAQLDLALQRFALDLILAKGFRLVAPPLMLRRAPYEGVTDLSDFENVMYKIEGDDLYLIATAEHPLGALHLGDLLEEEDLPIRLTAATPCFRREIGGHGVDQKGVFRVHQFQKVEQFVFCRPEDSDRIHEELRANAEDIFQKLRVPYRVVNVCTGDIGTVAAKKYDIEAYFAKQGAYREVVSCSNCTDYQARRLGIRMGKRGKPGKVVPHTLNSTAVATSRAMAVILENYQNADGTVTVPEVLRPYMGGVERIAPPALRPKAETVATGDAS